MKHILNNLTDEEKKSIREQHTGGMKVVNENFSKLIKATLGDSKPLVNEQSSRLKKMAQYVTENDHILTKNGKTIKINKGDIWRQKGMDASMLDFMVHEKTGITFLCDPSLGSQGFMSDEKNLYKFQNARPLVDSLRVKFCKGRTFNYDNYVSTECIRGLKSGREGFEGCNEMR